MSNTTAANEIVLTFGGILYRNEIPHSVGFTFYGIYLVFFCGYAWSTMQRPLKSPASRILLIAMLILFLSSTMQFVLDMTFTLEQLKGYLMWTDVALEDRRNLWLQKHEAIYVLERWPTAINFMISDLIVVWRASVMYPQRRWTQVGLWGVAVVDVVLWICAASFTSRDAVQRSHNPTTDEQLNTVGNFISLGTNLLGTGAIALKAWRQKQLMGAASVKKWRGDVPRILMLLVETGGIWAVIQLVFSILQEINQGDFSGVDMAVAVIGKAALYLAAILPTATVIIVRSHHLHSSVMDASHEVGGVWNGSGGTGTSSWEHMQEKRVKDLKAAAVEELKSQEADSSGGSVAG
ncbi:hypothetical protein DFH08DRAFT_1075483 [Mycena albidolilacea]|uniref:Uncharacterized protein n=1 Tax=Mycena albidolilacea TaxID=1033008 RepID=A0AAD7AGX4_9AGAR|nr:hypothetical protein DFH08DRAFT_1075483 [Mycena albidolilacea]